MKIAQLNRIEKRTAFIFKNLKTKFYIETGDPTTTLTTTSTITDPTNTTTKVTHF